MNWASHILVIPSRRCRGLALVVGRVFLVLGTGLTFLLCALDASNTFALIVISIFMRVYTIALAVRVTSFEACLLTQAS
ncbi:hypothetical protein MLD38_021338 [Melastoma candidum]|uniref:Uncharacterized protein n=1 Tax=Melastoma candidum TaxID=119954 RepID=A0ACB9QJ62_9MYRT|nr:hypothetical protein MLD38_021338 [Melastoma candidum]